MFVWEDIVEPVWHVGHAQAAHFLDLGRVRETGHVQDDRTQVLVRARLAELERLHVVVATAKLEVVPVRAPQSGVQLRVLDVPLVDEPGLFWVPDGDDVKARLLHGAIVEPGNIDVRPREFLLHLDVADADRGSQRNVREQLYVVTAAHLEGGRCVLRCRAGSRKSDEEHRPRYRSPQAMGPRGGVGARFSLSPRDSSHPTLTLTGFGAPSGPLSQS